MHNALLGRQMPSLYKSPLFPSLPQLLLFNMISYRVVYPFGPFGSAVLILFALPAPCGKLFPIRGALGAKQLVLLLLKNEAIPLKCKEQKLFLSSS